MTLLSPECVSVLNLWGETKRDRKGLCHPSEVSACLLWMLLGPLRALDEHQRAWCVQTILGKHWETQQREGCLFTRNFINASLEDSIQNSAKDSAGQWGWNAGLGALQIWLQFQSCLVLDCSGLLDDLVCPRTANGTDILEAEGHMKEGGKSGECRAFWTEKSVWESL